MSRPDSALVSLYETSNGKELYYGYLEADPATQAEALKITSQATGIQVYGEDILGGYEDCLDANAKCRNIRVDFKRWHARGKYVVTCKGECTDIWLSGEIVTHGTETDIDLGNLSDQADGRTTNVHLRFTTRDGSPVRVRVLHAHRPIIENPNQAYVIDTRYKGIFGALYPIWKAFVAIITKLLGKS